MPPRRGTEVIPVLEPLKKKPKIVFEQQPSLDISFCDDEALPPGIIFTDIQQKKWRIGKPIGRGSFGRIYLASDEVEKEVTKLNARYVVKIEPHTNGPLFVEIHCLIRTAQISSVKQWRQQNKKSIGMPVYIASGSFIEKNTGVKYRFLVIPRYDIDLQKIIARTKVLDVKNVLVLALQILDVLEYLHDQGYTHSDIKSSNLMLGFDSSKFNKNLFVKPTLSYQKSLESKDLEVTLSGKQRKAKTGKSRYSNYYEDEDFIVKNNSPKSLCSDDGFDCDKRLASVKNKLKKILNDKDSRALHRHHAFNLRQISSYVNYEDMNSSVCSDQSYQKLLDDFGNKKKFKTIDGHTHESWSIKNDENKNNLEEIQKEGTLSQSKRQIYLLDYGLASKFLDSKGNHKDFGMDARKAHDGTLEYSSRDSHIGAHSRRSDLETLGYNLLDWLTGTLPWKTAEILAEPDVVHALKKNFMSDVKNLLKTCFKTEFYPQFMEKYLEYVTSLDFVEKPDYKYCRNLFSSELIRIGANAKEVFINFDESSLSPMNRKKLCYSKRFGKKNTPPDFLSRNGIKKSYERENVCSLENDLKLELLKQTLNLSSDGVRKPCTSRNFFISDADLVARLKKSLMPLDMFGKKLSPKNLRSKTKTVKRQKKGKRTHKSNIGKFGNFMGSARQFTWAEILAGNPEDIIRKDRNNGASSNDDNDDFDDENCKFRIRKLSTVSSDSVDCLQSPLMQKDYLQGMNPTYAMKEVILNLKKKSLGKICLKDVEDLPESLEGYTPIMVKMFKLKQKREAIEKTEAIDALKLQVESKSRCTRSTKKIKPSNTKVPVRNTRNKTLIEEKQKFDVDTVDEEVVNKNKSTDKTKSNKNNKNVKKNVKTEDDITPVKKQTKITKKNQVTVPNNRMRLRSCKRNK